MKDGEYFSHTHYTLYSGKIMSTPNELRNKLLTVETLKREFFGSVNLQAEFGDLETYLSYRAAQFNGKAQILTGLKYNRESLGRRYEQR